jgi:hypothetical protein
MLIKNEVTALFCFVSKEGCLPLQREREREREKGRKEVKERVNRRRAKLLYFKHVCIGTLWSPVKENAKFYLKL